MEKKENAVNGAVAEDVNAVAVEETVKVEAEKETIVDETLEDGEAVESELLHSGLFLERSPYSPKAKKADNSKVKKPDVVYFNYFVSITSFGQKTRCNLTPSKKKSKDERGDKIYVGDAFAYDLLGYFFNSETGAELCFRTYKMIDGSGIKQIKCTPFACAFDSDNLVWANLELVPDSKADASVLGVIESKLKREGIIV